MDVVSQDGRWMIRGRPSTSDSKPRHEILIVNRITGKTYKSFPQDGGITEISFSFSGWGVLLKRKDGKSEFFHLPPAEFDHQSGLTPGSVATSAINMEPLETVGDRILAAIGRHADLDAAARQSWSDDAKELYYALLAARDLLRGDNRDEATAGRVRWLLEHALSAEAKVKSELRALGVAGKSLEYELDAVLRACRDPILALVTEQKRMEAAYPRVVQREPGRYVLPCAICGEPAVELVRVQGTDKSDAGGEARHPLHGGIGVSYRGIARSILIAAHQPDAIERVLAWAKAGDFASLHHYLEHEEKDEGGLDAYCPDCDLVYCRPHYRVREEWDEGFYDCSYGYCPRDHYRKIDD